jgi:hypothetical protein
MRESFRRLNGTTDGLRKESMRELILGGAALQRCDNRSVLNGGFSR